MRASDIEWTSRGAVGTKEDWKRIFPVKPLDQPTYAADVVGELERFDERDTLFARRELRPGTPRHEDYYGRRPQHQLLDDELRSLPYLGHTEFPENAGMLSSLFSSLLLLASEDAVEGRFVPAADGAPRSRMEPDVASRKVKGYAHLLGADLVGIGPLQKAFTYSHVGRTHCGQTYGKPIELSHPFAISLGVRMNMAGLSRTAPHFPEALESALAYARGALISVQLAGYIRSLGYDARAHHFRNYQILSVPVAVDGGLGELARCGFLVTQEFGSCLRLTTVTTDMPLELDRPVDIGVQEFCESCVVCAKACPAGAIPEGSKRAVRGVRKWALDAERCYRYWHEVGSDCGICIASCPWSRWTVGPRPSEGEPVVPGGFYVATRRPGWLE